MKKFIINAFIIVAIAVMTACSSYSNRGTVEKPFIGSANQTNMSFEKIELTDSSTVVYGVIHYRPGWWVRLSSGSFITADGVTYPMQSLEGIDADEKVTLPESGEIHFTMTYPPIPANVKSIDFSEGTDDGWQIWDIDLTGKADHTINLDKVPSRLLKDTSRPLPETMIAYGDSATVNVHLLGYRPEMGNRLRWAMNTLHGQTGVDTPVQVDNDGNATLELSITTPVQFFLIDLDNLPSLGSSAIVAPGETMNLYVDTHRMGIWNMNTRDGEDQYQTPDGYYPEYADGIYPNIKQNVGQDFVMQFYTGEFGDYHMNGDEYTAYIIDTYKSLNDSIDASEKHTEMGRKYNKATLMADLVFAASNARQMMFRNYYLANNVPFGSPIPMDSIRMELTPDNIKAIAEHIDFNNNDILLSDNIIGGIDVSMWEKAGVDPGVLKAVQLYKNTYDSADNGNLEDKSDIEKLRTLSAPLADEVEAHGAAMKARVEALDADLVTPTPNVAPDKVFDAIIAPHKGKVVMVDLWNTWCGPCRSALAANEPEKSGDLSSDDIVWVYIANQTSPQLKYMTAIKDIKGIHYKVDQDQWKAITDRFDVDGIPFYILVDREGKAVGRPDLRDHSLFKKTILEEVAK